MHCSMRQKLWTRTFGQRTLPKMLLPETMQPGAAGNNGSAFAGLNANTPWYNVTQGLTMLMGRYLMMIPVLAIAGCMVGKKAVPESLGTFPTNGTLFVVLLVGVVLIV
jgi:K+-transporting ATPase ATPase A chain